MKIVCVKGSPRIKGNSSLLADYFLKNFEHPENEIKTFKLNQLNYMGCQGCRKCLINDDLQEVLEAVRESDILVLASSLLWRTYFSS